MAQTKYQQLEDLWTAIRIIVKHKGGEEMSVKELRQAIYFEVAELEREKVKWILGKPLSEQSEDTIIKLNEIL